MEQWLPQLFHKTEKLAADKATYKKAIDDMVFTENRIVHQCG